ncbi:MAG TPA: aldolase/citrate lyase family protein [Bacteroidales bacterium]|nr:aldolase/citrate lyase family protein [Bacteroidales bacterium]
MIKSYFFIPANHRRLSDKIASIKADFLIIDIEDAITPSDREAALKKVIAISAKKQLWIRPIIFENDNQISSSFIQLIQAGFKNFIIPKIRNLKQLIQLEKLIDRHLLKEMKIIILAENPECIQNLQQIIEGTSIKIEAIGFGSQDYCTETGMKHSYEYLNVPRFQIMNIAKAFGLKCIDIASMDVYGGSEFIYELKQAFEMGYDGKFLIHPSQLNTLQQYPFFSSNEIKEAIEIIDAYNRFGQPSVFIFNNKVIEPPHIKQFTKIIKWSQQYENK